MCCNIQIIFSSHMLLADIFLLQETNLNGVLKCLNMEGYFNWNKTSYL